MSAVELLQKAVRLDANGRMLEALKLYQSGIDELLKVCKSKSFCFVIKEFELCNTFLHCLKFVHTFSRRRCSQKDTLSGQTQRIHDTSWTNQGTLQISNFKGSNRRQTTHHRKFDGEQLRCNFRQIYERWCHRNFTGRTVHSRVLSSKSTINNWALFRFYLLAFFCSSSS